MSEALLFFPNNNKGVGANNLIMYEMIYEKTNCDMTNVIHIY